MTAPCLFAGEVNLSLQQNSAIPTASDSIDLNYNFLAGNFADEKTETAWVTGIRQKEHWASLSWRNMAVEISRMEADFSPAVIGYAPIPAVLADAPPAPARSLKSTVPEKLEFEVEREGKWNRAEPSALEWTENAKATVRFDPPLKGVTAVRMRLPETSGDQIFALQDWKVLGPEVLGSFAQTPKWTGVWIWGEATPPLASLAIVTRYFRRTFDIPAGKEVADAVLMTVALDRATVFVNGHEVLRTPTSVRGLKPDIVRASVPVGDFVKGKNLLAIRGEDVEGWGIRGVLAELWLKFQDGSTQVIGTDQEFVTSAAEERGWHEAPVTIGKWLPVTPVSGANGPAATVFTAEYAPPFASDEIRLLNISITPSIPAIGQSFRLKLTLQAERPLTEAQGVVVSLGDSGPILPTYGDFSLGEIFTRPDALPKGFKGENTVEIEGIWPRGTPPRVPVLVRVCNRKTQARLVAGGPEFTEDGSLPGRLRWMAGQLDVPVRKGFPEVRVGDSGRMFVDGKPFAPVCYSSSIQTIGRYAQWAPSGVNLFRIGPHPTLCVIPPDGEEEAHYARLFASLKAQIEVLEAHTPDARFLLILDMDAQNEWILKHPEEQILSPGGERIMTTDLVDKTNGFVKETPNAPAYLLTLREGMKEFITRLEKQPYAWRVVGAYLTHGRGGENYWGGADIKIHLDDKGELVIPDRYNFEFGDVGVVARRNFRDWLKAKYQTKEALQAAWKMPDVDFEDLTSTRRWPGKRFTKLLMWHERPAGEFMFHDRVAEGSFFYDFVRHQNIANVDCFLEAGKAIKEASNNKLLVGGYLGYVIPAITNSPPALSQQSGHTEYRRILESPYFDISASPHFYHFRREGDPVMPMGVVDSLRLHDKIWFNEFDSRSFLSPIPPKTFGRDETREVLKKEFGFAITKSQGWWWYEFPYALVGPQAASWFGDEKLVEDASLMKRIYDRALTLPARGPSAECAVIFDVEQPYYTDAYSPANTVGSAVVNHLLSKLSKLGPSFDIFAQSDLPTLVRKDWLKQYKLLLFVNAYHLDTATRVLIEREVKKDGRTVVFFFAPGYLGNEADEKTEKSLQGIEAVTGMRGVARLDEEKLLGLKTAEGGRDFTVEPWWEVTQIATYGQKIGPVFYLDPSSANGWEALADLQLDGKVAKGKVALARKKDGNSTTYYSTLPDLPLETLAAIMRGSGLHFYTSQPGVLTWSNQDFLCVHAPDEKKQLTLTAKAPVTWIEPFEGREYARKTAQITIDLRKGETRFFCLETGDTWSDFVRQTPAVKLTKVKTESGKSIRYPARAP